MASTLADILRGPSLSDETNLSIDSQMKDFALGAKAKSTLDSLGRKRTRADSLMDYTANMPKGSFGVVSPYEIAAQVLGNSQGRRQNRLLDKQSEGLQQSISQGEAGKYRAGLEQAALKARGERDKWGYDAQTAAEKQAESVRQYEATASAKASAKGNPITMMDTDGTNPVTGYMTGRGFVDKKGNLVDISRKVPWDKEGAGGAGGGVARKPLTAGQMQTGLKDLEKVLKPIEGVHQSMLKLDELLLPYTKGGVKQDEGIGGIGGWGGQRGEGWGGTAGDVIRYVDDATTIGEAGDSQKISSAISGLIAPIIRDQAGLAQTMSETKKVIDKLGLQAIGDEETFLDAYPQLKAAMRRDLDRIRRTRSPEVLEFYEQSRYGESMFSRPVVDADFSNRSGVRPPANQAQTPAGSQGFTITEIK